jgi:predicted NAD/FAD-binding protein/CRP-like cAMP-binding protein
VIAGRASLAKVAVVGGGAAGIGAAIALTRSGMDVALFETEARLGGHCYAVAVAQWDGRTIRVDAGVSEYNPAACPRFVELLRELDLRPQPVNADIAVMTPQQVPVWHLRDGTPVFRRPPQDPQRFLGEIARFNRSCLEVLDDPAYAAAAAQRYLDDKQYSAEFRALYFDPLARATLAMPGEMPGAHPIRGLVASWRMLGLVGPDAQRMTLQGGLHSWCDAAERWLRARNVQVFLSTRVASIARLGDSVRLRAIDAEKSSRHFAFDHVIIATSPDQAAAFVEDATQDEARVYAAIKSRRVRQVVHLDPQLLPADRATWGACIYVTDGEAGGPTVTRFLNRQQNLPASVPDVFVTTNPITEPDTAKVLSDRHFDHPVIDAEAEQALLRLDAMQGQRRTWFCGGYLRAPFAHEQAYRDGLETAERLVTAVADAVLKLEAGVAAREAGFDEFFRDIPLFADLDARALTEIQLAARPFLVDAGTMLFRQGDAPDGFYLIKRGAVDILRRVPGDQVVKVAALGPHAIVGEMSLLDGHLRSTHAVATAQTFGYFVSAEQFRILRTDYRPVAFQAMNCFRREVARRARSVIEQISPAVVAADPRPGPSASAAWPHASAAADFSAEALQALPFFRTFRPAELRELVAPLRLYEFARGQLVYAAGEPARNCLVVVRGALGLNFSTPQGLSGFSLLGPGRIAGELALIDGGPQPLACVAREATIAFEIDRIGFELLRRGGSIVAWRFFEAVTSGVVGLLRKASAHMARIAPERAPGPVSEPVREAT